MSRKLGSVTFREGNSHSKPVGDVRWNCSGFILFPPLSLQTNILLGDYLASASFDKTTKIGQLDNNGNVF
jgi:hypothetical protein